MCFRDNESVLSLFLRFSNWIWNCSDDVIFFIFRFIEKILKQFLNAYGGAIAVEPGFSTTPNNQIR